MPAHHTLPTRCHPTIPGPQWTTVPPRWPQAIAVVMPLGLFVMTIRAAVHEQGVPGVWATIAFWAVMGIPAALDSYGRAYGYLPPPRWSDKWR